MKPTKVCVLALISVGQHVLCNRTAAQKSEDIPQLQLALAGSAEASLVDNVFNVVMTLSDSQREDLMVKLLEQQDVVDVMRITGHGEGLDEERLVQVFGEDSPRV